MKFIVLLALVALSIVAVAGSSDKDVVVLTDDNFESTLSETPLALVEFYAPWCGHCKNLEPTWNEAATKMAGDASLEGVRLCKIDADGQKKSGTQHKVTGFPTIKLFRNGQFAEDFDGQRTADGIISYLQKKNQVAVNKEISNLATLKTLLKNLQRTTIVGFFTDKTSVDYKYFSQVVVGFAGNGIDAFHATSPAVLEGFGFFGSGSSITMYRPNAKPHKVSYRGTIFKQQLKEWIVEHAVPAVGVYDKESEALYKLSSAPLVRLLASNAPTGVLEAASKKFPAVKFAFSPIADFQAEVEAHCGKSAVQCFIGHEASKNGKAGKAFGEPSKDGSEVVAFTENLLAKKLVARIKSEPAGAAPAAGSVAVVVGSTFESIVADPTKDVFIEFYAPWCGHCKALTPKYEELAQEMAPYFDSLVIAKVDLTNNDLPEEYKAAYPVQGFPTLFLAPKDNKKAPIQYDAPREVSDMKKWLMEKAKL